MKTLDLTKIGQFGRTHGIAGELHARITVDEASFFQLATEERFFIFAEIEGLPVPFRLERTRTKSGDFILIKLAYIDSLETAERLVNAEIFIESNELSEDAHFSPAHFIGFTLYDGEDKAVGRVVAVDDSTLNILFSVERPDGSTILLPIADDLLEYVDAENQRIAINIPEGLIEI